jgi:Na+-translocating ferredoxin:NAD+ oxidoreductase RnfE subunit
VNGTAPPLSRRWVLLVLDLLVVCVAYVGALLVRFAGEVPGIYWSRAAIFVPLAAVASVVLGFQVGAYSNKSPVRRAALAGLLTGVLIIAGDVLIGRWMPLSVVAMGAVAAMAGFILLRIPGRPSRDRPSG